jgi:putative SOS response-associated peptidase YedK
VPAPVFACVMVTVPASRLISPITDRMPAILEDADWPTWLGEIPASPEAIKAVLKTMEGVNWKMETEPKKSKGTPPAKPPETNRSPGLL